MKTLAAIRRLPTTAVRSAPTFKRWSSSKPCTKYTTATHTTAPLPDNFPAQYLLNTYARPPLVITHGKGSWAYTATGDKYLDFTAGIAVNALGHADAGVADAMAEQARQVVHTSNGFWNAWVAELAKLIVELTRKEGGLGFRAGSATPSEGSPGAKVFFSNSGTEANEGAFKFARKYGKERWAAQAEGRDWKDSTKTKIVHFTNAFHGRSMGALSATPNPKYQAPFGPLIPGFEMVEYGDIEGVNRAVGEDTCAVIVEPIQGEGGVHTGTEEFLRAIRKACDRVGAVLIFDEIQCGLYRTGTLWAHSSLPVDCHPDIVTMAKPLANGYPIGAVLVRDKIAEAVTQGSHGTTFGGSPLATRVGHHVLSRLSDAGFVTRLRGVAEHLNGRVSELPTMFPELIAGPIRGRGLIRGIPFKNGDHPAELVAKARERGVLLLTAGKDAVRLVPSLNVSKEEVDFAMDVIESSLSLLQG